MVLIDPVALILGAASACVEAALVERALKRVVGVAAAVVVAVVAAVAKATTADAGATSVETEDGAFAQRPH
jgi:hypothetical protein